MKFAHLPSAISSHLDATRVQRVLAMQWAPFLGMALSCAKLHDVTA
jgi:hypothetical protein